MQSTYKQHRPGRGVVEIASGVLPGFISTTPIFFDFRCVGAHPDEQDNSSQDSSILHIVGNRQFVGAV